MGIKQTFNKWKKYSKMSDLGEISRRKFFNNFFDGLLTSAGLISGIFILFLANPSLFSPSNVLVAGFATAFAIGISGLWGAYLSEEAERKKKIQDMKKEMAIYEGDELKNEVTPLEKDDSEEFEIKKAMVTLMEHKRLKHITSTLQKDNTSKKKKKKKSLLEQAENFATIVASLVDGGAPVLGSSLPLIPFFFGITLTIIHFIFSYIILVGLLVYLGIFLGNISGGGRVRYVMHLVTAGVVTLIVSLLLGQLSV